MGNPMATEGEKTGQFFTEQIACLDMTALLRDIVEAGESREFISLQSPSVAVKLLQA